MRSMCVFRRKYMRSAALTPDRPPARPPGRQPSPASPPGSRSASQRVPRASGIIVGNANEVLNRNMLRTDLSPAYIQQPRRNGRSPGRSAAAPRKSAAFYREPPGVSDLPQSLRSSGDTVSDCPREALPGPPSADSPDLGFSQRK